MTLHPPESLVGRFATELVKICPQCQDQNASVTRRCACGYKFTGTEPILPSPPFVSQPPFGHSTLLIVAAILTFVAAIIAAHTASGRIAFRNFRYLASALALVFCGFTSFLYCYRVLISSHIGWVVKLLSLLLIVLGFALLGVAIIWGGCSSTAFINN